MTVAWAPHRARNGALSLFLAGGALWLVALTGGSAAASPEPAAPTLGTVVIPALGPGYAVTSQGPLQASQFASDAPDPAAAAGALSTLGKTISTYERVWQADGGLNQVQNLLVRFPDATGAQVFLQAAQHSLESGEIVSSDPVASIPGARRVTYFAATNEDGVGEAITMGSGVYVDLLSFFSAASGNAQPISPANAETVARAQYKAMTQAPGGRERRRRRSGRRLLQEVRLGRHHPGRRARGGRPGAGRGHTVAAPAASRRADDGSARGALRRRRGPRSARTQRVRSPATGGPTPRSAPWRRR